MHNFILTEVYWLRPNSPPHPAERHERPVPLWWQGACVCGCEDSHMHGILLALGIIYKAWFLCGTQSPCLLPLQPMTLPGLLLPPRLHRELSLGFCLSPSSLLLSRETGFIFIYPVAEKKPNNSLPWKILIYIGKKNLYTPERHTKLCSPIPYGLNYPVIQESFFFCGSEGL